MQAFVVIGVHISNDHGDGFPKYTNIKYFKHYTDAEKYMNMLSQKIGDVITKPDGEEYVIPEWEHLQIEQFIIEE